MIKRSNEAEAEKLKQSRQKNMKIMKKLLLFALMVLSIQLVQAQWAGSATPLGLTYRTGNVGIGPGGPGSFTSNFPLQISPSITSLAANAQGWKRGIMLTASSTLYWQNSTITANSYFMGHCSSNPVGDFYQGYSVGVGPAAPVNYSSKVWVTNPPSFIPAASTQFFKNVLVQEDGSTRRFGVNLLNPKRAADILFASGPQLRLTRVQNNNAVLGVYTDFETNAQGHMIVRSRFNNSPRNFGIDVVPQQKLDVLGNARLRIVPSLPANYIMTGIMQGSNPNDIVFSKLAFSGNPTQVLLGNGTWGTLPSSTPAANNGLSVVSTGIGTFIQLGQNCNESTAPGKLLNPREIPMNTHNIYFTGQGLSSTHAIGLGYAACFTPLPAKFSTLQQNTVPVASSSLGGSFVNKDLVSSGSAATITGVNGISDQAQPAGNITNMGGQFTAANAPLNVAVNGVATGNAGSQSTTAGQFFSTSTNPGTNLAVVARASGGASINYGVLTSASGGTNSYGIFASNTGTAPNHWAGWFQGDVNFAGTVWGSQYMWTSDKRYKNDIKQLTSVSEKLAMLKGYTYQYRTEEFKEKNFPKGEQIGFIAQELKEVFPQLVMEDGQGYNTVNYVGIIPVLVEAFKEQRKEVEELKALVKNLTGVISENGTGASDKVGNVTLNDAQAIVLEQNVPNPFAEQTSISYTLTDGVQKAQILFYNMDGKLINSSDLKPLAGKGMLNVFASDLSNGIYTYTLVADGKIIESKRMVKNK
jgi:hypothetical protein